MRIQMLSVNVNSPIIDRGQKSEEGEAMKEFRRASIAHMVKRGKWRAYPRLAYCRPGKRVRAGETSPGAVYASEGLSGARGLDQPLYLFDAAEAMIFDGPDFELAVATSADWTDASSQFHTGFAEDSSLVRAIAGRDFALVGRLNGRGGGGLF
jgi:hypothetical protein